MKKQKTVFKSRELAHVWAHQSAPEGRCPGHMHFSGDTFYSYSTAIGKLMRNKSGEQCALINDGSFSNTTSKHQGHVRYAASHLTRFHGDFGGFSSGMNLKPSDVVQHYIKESKEETATKHKLKRIEAAGRVRAKSLLDEASRAAVFFGLSVTQINKELDKLEPQLKEDYKLLEEYDAKRRVAQEKRDANRSAKRKAWEQREAERQKENIEKWRNGENVSVNYCHVMLRVEQIGDEQDSSDSEIVTSMGARIPYEDGKRTFNFYVKVHDRGWRRNGETFQIGAYQLDAANPEGLIAGCHRISHEEIMRLATQEGWVTESPQSTETTQP